ncbi:hypothetical protein BC828DRAFT_15324 [Blastocladiella britannica]|nr:hypothetical protein BC828DRAFT_15324 [Blastocladiella britannica]
MYYTWELFLFRTESRVILLYLNPVSTAIPSCLSSVCRAPRTCRYKSKESNKNMDRLPEELLVGILASACTPASHIPASARLLSHMARIDFVLIAWAHHILARSDASVMSEAPGLNRHRPATLDAQFNPDTRGLPTPATWLMKRLVRRGLAMREMSCARFDNVPVADLELVENPFTVPAVVDYLLQPHRFRNIANMPLDELVRAWDVLFERDSPDGIRTTWVMSAPEPLATHLATPNLRPVPEALQLPGLYLLTGELDQFMDTTRRLAAMLPTLATATAPLTLWMRLGIDDRIATRRSLSVCTSHASNTHVTLPMYWALLAVTEGRVAVLEHLVTDLYVLDLPKLMAFLSQPVYTVYFMRLLVQFSAADRVFPTWHWLYARGYAYPTTGIVSVTELTAQAAEFATLRTFFFEYDKPRILATTLMPRRVLFTSLVGCNYSWARRGYYEVMIELAELGLMTPYKMLMCLRQTPPDVITAHLAVIESLCAVLEGGMDAVLAAGSLPSRSDGMYPIGTSAAT